VLSHNSLLSLALSPLALTLQRAPPPFFFSLPTPPRACSTAHSTLLSHSRSLASLSFASVMHACVFKRRVVYFNIFAHALLGPVAAACRHVLHCCALRRRLQMRSLAYALLALLTTFAHLCAYSLYVAHARECVCVCVCVQEQRSICTETMRGRKSCIMLNRYRRCHLRIAQGLVHL
jgi:hypothetical protein